MLSLFHVHGTTNLMANIFFSLFKKPYLHLNALVLIDCSLQTNYQLSSIIFCIYVGSTFRHTRYPAYKSNRPPTPDTIVQGLQYLKASIKSMSVKVIEVINC